MGAKANTNIFLRFINYIKWLYMLYELNTQISICEPWEKIFCNTLIVTLISLILYSTFVYIPGYVVTFQEYMLPNVVTERLT